MGHIISSVDQIFIYYEQIIYSIVYKAICLLTHNEAEHIFLALLLNNQYLNFKKHELMINKQV